MNKFTKRVLNYVAGAIILIILLVYISRQIRVQLQETGPGAWMHTGPWYLAALAGILFLINTSLEGFKWYLLVRFVAPVSYRRAFTSYLSGITFSVLTPNRIGEYPGRLLALDRENTLKYANVSVLGIMSQLSAVYIFGFAGLVYYNQHFPAPMARAALYFCLAVSFIWVITYWNFERWLSYLQRIKWLNQLVNYCKLLKQIPIKVQLTVFCISLLRFAVFTAQYLILLRWMQVNVPIADGFLTAALFYWVMAVVPSVSLTEFGVRGNAGLFLFGHFSGNTIGILGATTIIWLVNLMIPAIIGSILIFRMKWIR